MFRDERHSPSRLSRPGISSDLMRLDQWLWAVRVYKTRTLSVTAIRAGHVKLNGEPTKPAHEVRAGELVTAQTPSVLRALKVVAAPTARVSAKLVGQFAEDLTPPEQLQRRVEPGFSPPPRRPKGAGRPTKRDRRALDQLEL